MTSILQKVRLITNWTDPEMSEIVGLAKPTIQAYRCGRLPEKLSPAQRAALLAELKAWLALAINTVEEIEFLS